MQGAGAGGGGGGGGEISYLGRCSVKLGYVSQKLWPRLQVLLEVKCFSPDFRLKKENVSEPIKSRFNDIGFWFAEKPL